eukprot:243000_1
MASTDSDQVTKSCYFLPGPTQLDSISFFNTRNILFIQILAICFVLLAVIVVGYIHSSLNINHYRIMQKTCICYICNLADNFYPSRILYFIFSLSVQWNHINTLYSYFYQYNCYCWNYLLIMGSLTLLLTVLNIVLNLLLFRSFRENEIINSTGTYLKTWISEHKWTLIVMIIFSESFSYTLLLVNSNLFGMNIFGMKLSRKQLFKCRIPNIQSVLLSMLYLMVHSWYFLYIANSQYFNFHSVAIYFNVLAIMFSILNLVRKIVTRYFPCNVFQYEEITVDLKIEVSDNVTNDILQLQKRKHLTTQLKNTIVTALEISANQLEILQAEDTLDGINISGVIYKEITSPTNILQNGYESAPLELLLLNNDTLSETRDEFKEKLLRNPINQNIQQIYGVQNSIKLTIHFH